MLLSSSVYSLLLVFFCPPLLAFFFPVNMQFTVMNLSFQKILIPFYQNQRSTSIKRGKIRGTISEISSASFGWGGLGNVRSLDQSHIIVSQSQNQCDISYV